MSFPDGNPLGFLDSKVGMEYCAVQGPFNASLARFEQRFDVRKDVERGLCIAAIHSGYVGGNTRARRLLDLRADLLVPYVLNALGTRPARDDIKPALEMAFRRMDEEVNREAQSFKEFKYPELYRPTKLNSVVVIVHDGWVYRAGVTDARVVLSRNGAPVSLDSKQHQLALTCAAMMHEEQLPSYGSDEPALFYFHQERLESEDEYLVIASEQLFHYLPEMKHILPVLQSRIDAEGLEEACKSMVGRFMDQSKILVVITLQERAHEPKERNKRARLDEKVLQAILNAETFDWEEECVVRDPLRYLLPYVNGRKQDPVPQTSSEYATYRIIQKPCPEEAIQIASSLCV